MRAYTIPVVNEQRIDGMERCVVKPIGHSVPKSISPKRLRLGKSQPGLTTLMVDHDTALFIV